MPAKKTAAKKTAAKKTAAKKTAAKKTAAKKTAAKKTAAKKTAARKTAAKKTAAKRPSATTTAAKKASARKSAAKKAAAKKPAGKVPASDFDAAIERIEAKATAAGIRLAAGASAKEIASAEKALGLTLPAEVVAFYRRHDGSPDIPAVQERELLSLSRMVSEWSIWKDLLDSGTFDPNDQGQPGPGVQRRWWISEWIPFTYDGAGNHHMIDLAPAKGGTYGQILDFWHDDPSRTVVAQSLLAWLEQAYWGGYRD